MSLVTTKWGFIYPEETDPDDVPSWLQQLAEQLDVIITGFSANTWALRPTGAAIKDGLIFWATDQGLFYLGYGGTLHSLSVPFGAVGDIAAESFGDVPVAGVTGKAADAGHRHGMPANPITGHIAAGDPHAQYLLRLGMTSVDELERLIQRIDTRRVDLTYTGTLLTGVTEKDSTGATTVRTTTLAYTGTVLNTVTEVANGKTITTTLGYDGSGNLNAVTRTVV